MATLDYNLGTPLGPDPRAVADLAAIDDFVRTTARAKVDAYPDSLPLIEDYERWRQSVSWWGMNVMVNDTMRTAKAKRDAINRAQESVLPPGHSVEEGAFVTPPDDPEQLRNRVGWGLAVGLLLGALAWWRIGRIGR